MAANGLEAIQALAGRLARQYPDLSELVSGFAREDDYADRLFEKYGFRDIGLRKLDLVLSLTSTPPATD